MQTELMVAARDYISKGVNVIPVRDKIPVLKSWASYQFRFVSEAELSNWELMQIPNGFAAITGKLSGIAVVDVDDVNVMHLYDLPETVKAASGRGIHLYYAYPEGETIKSLSAVRPGIDVKAAGGLITLPPSQHANGKQYQWVIPFSREALAPLPSWLVEELKEKPIPIRTSSTHASNGIRIHHVLGKGKNSISSHLVELAREYPIENIAEDYTSLKRNGFQRLVGLCPFHEEKTPSFTLYLTSNTFYCFGCSKYGDGITLLRELEGLSFVEAVRTIREKE